jgi:hypothetical protein
MEEEGERLGSDVATGAPPGPTAPGMDFPPPVATPPLGSTQGPHLAESLIARAKANDKEALATMFAQFLPSGEEVVDCHYLGVLGLWGVGTHSFAAVTARRIATLRISLLGGVHYQEGALEYVNSAAVHQPSIVSLYLAFARYVVVALVVVIWTGVVIHALAALALAVIAVLFVPVYVRYYYRRHKSGVVLWIREGISVDAFIDRGRMLVANRLYRECMNLREERLRAIGRP